MKEYPTIQHRWFDQVWNQGDECAIDEMLKPGVIGHGLTDAEGNEIVGVEHFKAFYRAFRSAFPDIHVEVEDAVTEGDQVVARCLVTATHTGEGFAIAPTGRQVSFPGVCWSRIEDGRIAETWNHFDFLTLMTQLQS